MSLLRKGTSEDSTNRSLKPERPPPPKLSSKDAEAPPTNGASPQQPYQATPSAPPPSYQATPSAPPQQPYYQPAMMPGPYQHPQQPYYQGPIPGNPYQPQQGPNLYQPQQGPIPGTPYQPQQGPYMSMHPGASYYAPPPGLYQAPPPGLYQAPPPPHMYQVTPPYQTAPPQQQYQTMPGMQPYQATHPNGTPSQPPTQSLHMYPPMAGGLPLPPPIPPLQIHEVRWFHTKNGKYWQPFCGGDSLKLEVRYQTQLSDPSAPTSVDVMGDLYEANLKTMMCRAIYWSDPQQIFRNNFADPKKVNACEMSAQLCAAGLLSLEQKEQVENEKVSSIEDRSAKLLMAVERVIKLDDTKTKFDDFLGVLDKFSKYQELVKKLKADHFTMLRGTWFEVQGDKWYPFEEAEALSIEKKHCGPDLREKIRNEAVLKQAADDRLKSLGKPPQQITSVIDRLALEKCEVIWMSNGDISKRNKDVSTMVVAKIGEIINKPESFGGVCIKRGYRERASLEDQLPPIGHLVFVIHGIGQNMDSSDISKSTSDFRETCAQVAKKNFPEQWKEKRVEFIPLDWRTSLTLDDGMLKNITLHGVKTLRDMLNDSVLDIFFYTSLKYGPEILRGLHTAIHEQYRQFIKHHPHFHEDGGAVTIFAHSLGSVMTYDLLHESCLANNIRHDNPVPQMVGQTLPVEIQNGGGVKYVQRAQSVTAKAGDEGQPVAVRNGEAVEPVKETTGEEGQLMKEYTVEKDGVPDSIDRSVGNGKLEADHLKLDFNVEHFFAVGSPLGIFILMREHESLVKRGHRSSASLVPTEVCKRIHNLHHPSDPVAYRLEPLINDAYASIKPVKVDSAGSKPSKTALDHAEGPKTDEKLTAPSGQSGSWMSSLINVVTNPKKQTPDPKQDKDKLFDNDNHLPPTERLKERLDFSLKEGVVDISYVNTLTAHTGYWTSADCALYVLLQIYKYKGVQSNL